MKNEWKYKIDVVNPEVFAEIEKERKITFPDELKELIIEANAATPAKYNFMAGSSEKVLGAVLSFNRNETDTDSVFVALSAVTDTNLLPFFVLNQKRASVHASFVFLIEDSILFS